MTRWRVLLGPDNPRYSAICPTCKRFVGWRNSKIPLDLYEVTIPKPGTPYGYPRLDDFEPGWFGTCMCELLPSPAPEDGAPGS